MENNRLLELIIRRESRELAPQEQLELFQLLSNAEAKQLSNSIGDLFHTPMSFDYGITNDEFDHSLESLLEKVRDKSAKTKTRPAPLVRTLSTWLVAASVILLLVSALFFYLSRDSTDTSQNVITAVTNKGSKSTITLPDGSKVRINSDTKLTYDRRFGGETREVKLEGEAYFDVVKDKSKPFIVHTNTVDIKVLGTTFNVRAYENENNTQTTLIKGAVEVILGKSDKKTIKLNPNEKIIVQNDFETSKESKKPGIKLESVKLNATDSTTIETKWTIDKLAFEDENLENILKLLERWYNIEIVTKIQLPSSKVYSGTFEKDDAMTDVLESLKLAGGFNYTIDKKKIVIY